MKCSAKNLIRIQLLSADPMGALFAMNQAGIVVYDGYCREDEITAEFSIHRKELPKLRELSRKKGYDIQVIELSSIDLFFGFLKRRRILIVTITILLALTILLPSRVLFVRVEGNRAVPDRKIMALCRDYGIQFGASRREIRSEQIKNALLAAIPELQWVGVTTDGCVATVTVKERLFSQSAQEDEGLKCIVAGMDGQILSYTVTSGTVLCQRDQFVRKGDVLVSGYCDTGFHIQAVGAAGEVYGRTVRQLSALTPEIWSGKTSILRQEKKYALIIGKKRINFYKGSGISGGTCDKIYEENYITLPGGFQLPIAIRTELWSYYETEAITIDRERMLEQIAHDQLIKDMIAGVIESSDETVTSRDGMAYLQGEYICTEMIGRIENEEILKPYGNDN